jgi:acetylornithine deacetylase/succinyl-diaminopimelate desuccinylase-like protein
MSARPSLDVNGITGGYQGNGTKTVIPAQASFKVSMRLAPNQDPEDIWKKFESHVLSFDSPTARVSLATPLKAHPALLLSDSPIVDAMKEAYTKAWGVEPEMMRMGGSLPLLGMFESIIGLPTVVFAVNTGAHVHSPNEYMFLEYFDKNIETAIRFYGNLDETLRL